MSFFTHLPLIRSAALQLTNFASDISATEVSEADEEAPCSRLLVAQGMENLIEQVPLFDACLTQGTPFMQHFLECLKGFNDDDTCAESIFEDMVIFFREKALRLPPSRITPIEREIMQQFEQIQPLEDPESMVRRWYWIYLPSMVLHDLFRAQGLDRKAGEQYMRAVTGDTLC